MQGVGFNNRERERWVGLSMEMYENKEAGMVGERGVMVDDEQ